SCMITILISFTLILRLPPRPTLFPYTTLFRSEETVTAASSPPGALSPLVRISSDDQTGFTAQVVGLPEIQATAPTREEAIEKVRDRKSTRLNSSHSQISYAVFCLKKKKKIKKY